MSLEIKICGLTTPQGVLAAAEAGATAIGLVFAESVRRIELATGAELARVAPRSLKRVAVFRHPPRDLVARVLAEVEVDRVQTDADDYDAISDALGDVEFVPVYRDGPDLRERVLAGELAGLNDGLVLVEGPSSGAGVSPDWGRIAGLGSPRVIIAGGLSPANVAEVIRAVRPGGVDVSSGVESGPGVKDPAKIRAFVRAARDAFTGLSATGTEH
jgi:phosphoribosylanthranilate isomerase